MVREREREGKGGKRERGEGGREESYSHMKVILLILIDSRKILHLPYFILS